MSSLPPLGLGLGPMFVLNNPAWGLLAKNSGTQAAILRVQLAIANGLEHIVVRDPGGGARHMGFHIRNSTEEVDPRSPLESRAVFRQPLLNGLAGFCFPILNPAIVGSIKFEHRPNVSRCVKRF